MKNFSYKKFMLIFGINFLIVFLLFILIYLKPPKPLKFSEDNLLAAVLIPHPPLMLEEVGGLYSLFIKKTVISVEKALKEIVQAKPDTIIIITPHSKIRNNCFSIYAENDLYGDFTKYNVPKNVKVQAQSDVGFIKKLIERLTETSLKLSSLNPGTKLDHGVTVPLYFLNKAGFEGKIVVINHSEQGIQEHLELGRLIRKVIDSYKDKKFVFIASGSLSHNLKPFAPNEYIPETIEFDKTIIKAFKEGNYNLITGIDRELEEITLQCGYKPIIIGLGIINKTPLNNQVLSYEAPVGVGYLVAEF